MEDFQNYTKTHTHTHTHARAHTCSRNAPSNLWSSCLHWPLLCTLAFLSHFHQNAPTHNLKAPAEILPLTPLVYPSCDGWQYLRSSQPVHQSPAIKTLGMTSISLSLSLSRFLSLHSILSLLNPRVPPCLVPICRSPFRPPPSSPLPPQLSHPRSLLPFLPPTLVFHFNCPQNPTIHLVEKKHHLFGTSQIIYFFSLSPLALLFSFSPLFYRNSPFPYKMKIHLELHLMSSLCLLSVDDVYEELRRAAECLMMHKIKPSLSAVLRLPSASQAAETRWGNRLQTAIRWTGEKKKLISSLRVSREERKVWSWCTRVADGGESELAATSEGKKTRSLHQFVSEILLQLLLCYSLCVRN